MQNMWKNVFERYCWIALNKKHSSQIDFVLISHIFHSHLPRRSVIVTHLAKTMRTKSQIEGELNKWVWQTPYSTIFLIQYICIFLFVKVNPQYANHAWETATIFNYWRIALEAFENFSYIYIYCLNVWCATCNIYTYHINIYIYCLTYYNRACQSRLKTANENMNNDSLYAMATNSRICYCSLQYPWSKLRIKIYIKGILPKGPYLPCVSMAGRALLAGYHRYTYL